MSKHSYDPADYTSVFGSTFVKYENRPLLQIGNRTWSRLDLGRLGCPHPVAAANIQKTCQQLGITSIADLAKRANGVGTLKGNGVTVYYTLLGILAEAGYDVEVVHGVGNKTFASMKKQRETTRGEKRLNKEERKHRQRAADHGTKKR